MTELRDDPRFIGLMDEYVALLQRDRADYDPAISRRLKALGSQIEDEYGQAALEEADDWVIP